MKFFTRKWAEGSCDENDSRMVPACYDEYLLGISNLLPRRVLDFVREVNLHDGLFQGVVLAPHTSRLAMKIRCGDLHVGYFDVNLEYTKLALLDRMIQELDVVVNNAATEILYDEIDVFQDSVFEHRLLCDPTGELVIRFGSFSFSTSKVSNRKFTPVRPRFVVTKSE